MRCKTHLKIRNYPDGAKSMPHPVREDTIFSSAMFLQAKALIIKTNTYQNKYLPQDGMPDGNPFRDRRDVLLKRIQINVLRARKAKRERFLVLTEKCYFATEFSLNGSQIYLQNIVELKLKVMSEISSKVVEIIKDRLNVAEKDIELTSSFANDLGADSLDTVELIMEFEKEFGISIPDEDAEKITTVGDAINYIEAHKA